MFKKILFIFLSFFSLGMNYTFAAQPKVNCEWLPGCEDGSDSDIGIETIANVIWLLIQYVAVIAVIALILSGMMYLISWGDEEKAKKAKSWVTWSLVWVILSISAWWIINMLNKIVIW